MKEITDDEEKIFENLIKNLRSHRDDKMLILNHCQRSLNKEGDGKLINTVIDILADTLYAIYENAIITVESKHAFSDLANRLERSDK